MEQNKAFWLRVIYITLILLLLCSGFIIGYLFNSPKECVENPLIYSVKRLNDINNDEYICSCYSLHNGFRISFNEEEVKIGEWFQIPPQDVLHPLSNNATQEIQGVYRRQ